MAKQQRKVTYRARLDRVVDHIYRHLDEDIRPEGLAEIACLSPYHWHRIYVAMRGETVSATIRRLRLSKAADRLANSDMPTNTIAERAGYSGADSFGRAFREAYGKTPADYRVTGSHAAFKAATEAEDHAGFPVAIETLPAVRCVSVAHTGLYTQIVARWGASSRRSQRRQSWRRIRRCAPCSSMTPILFRSKHCVREPARQSRLGFLSFRRWKRRFCAGVSTLDCAIVDPMRP